MKDGYAKQPNSIIPQSQEYPFQARVVDRGYDPPRKLDRVELWYLGFAVIGDTSKGLLHHLFRFRLIMSPSGLSAVGIPPVPVQALADDVAIRIARFLSAGA